MQLRNIGRLFGALVASSALVVVWLIHERSHESFAAHMVQHMVLMAVAAPAIVTARPTTLSSSPIWCPIFLAVLWIWHFPLLFNAALHNQALHLMEHIIFVGSAAMFWWGVLRPPATVAGHVRALAILFIGTLGTTALGALITFAQTPLYFGSTTAHSAAAALAEQQLAGLIMWVPMGAIFLVSFVHIFRKLLTEVSPKSGRATAEIG